jgi:hypothetical protein
MVSYASEGIERLRPNRTAVESNLSGGLAAQMGPMQRSELRHARDLEIGPGGVALGT